MTIMTDALFKLYGGEFGDSNDLQRSIAYEIAEDLISQHIGTPLSITPVTGVLVRSVTGFDRYVLPHTYVVDVPLLLGWYDDSFGTTTAATGTAYVHAYEDGIVQVIPPVAGACSGCGDSLGLPNRYQIVYRAGLPSGTITGDKRAMLALKIQCQKALDQIVDPAAAEGGAGDPGVQAWSEAGHSEQRVQLLRTSFGTSALDNYSKQLLEKWVRKRPLRL